MPKNFDAPSHEKKQCDCEDQLPLVLTVRDLEAMLLDANHYRELRGIERQSVCIVLVEEKSALGWKITTIETE